MKKTIVLLATLAFLVSLTGTVFASDLMGKVTKVKGNTVTIEIIKGKAAQLDVGNMVEIEAKESKGAPKKGGMDMLQGC